MTCIYMITNTITGDFYIGQTIDMHERELAHRREPPPKMREDVKEYSWDAFKFEIVEECSREELNDRENYYITELDPAYNTIKIHNWTHTPETCEKIRQAKLGQTHAPESCEMMSSQRLHKSLKEEHVEKCRQSSFGNKSRSKPIMCVETGKIYPNAKIAAADVGLKSSSGITDVLRGVRVTAGGYHWRYPDGDENTGSQHRNLPVTDEDTGKIYPTIDAAAEDLGISATTISRIAYGQTISTLHFKFLQEPTYNEIRTVDKRFGSTAHKTAIICKTTGQEFSSLKEASEILGIPVSNISSVLNGKSKTAHGYTFRYVDGQSHKIVSRRVRCIETGEEFNNVNDAAESISRSPRTVATHLRGYKKSVGGFHFEYILENDGDTETAESED